MFVEKHVILTLENVLDFERIEAKAKRILQHHHVIVEFEEIPEENRQKLVDGAFGEVLRYTQEAIVLPPWVTLAVHPRPGVWEYLRANVHALVVEELQCS
ncbi:Sucrose synthase [Sesbania bispinosa]|nr:Sucrose synthase [Sesbania bispinosa]